MNLFDTDTDNIIIINIDGKDIEMKLAMCFGKIFDNWLVSKCGRVWSFPKKRFLRGSIHSRKNPYIQLKIRTEEGYWEDGSGWVEPRPWNNPVHRKIMMHRLVIDTWKPLWDNPPEGITWEQWEIVRELDTVYNHISKVGSIDHIDNNKTNNHIDNLRRVNDWDNNFTRKEKGI